MLATRLAQGAGRRRGAARHAARPRARGADARRSSRRSDGETLVTPPLDDHILDSITRARVLESGARRRSAPITLDELPAPTEAFLASTTREVQPVARDRRRRAARGAGPAHAAAPPSAIARARSPPRCVSPRHEGPHRHREPAAVRQGGGGLARALRERHEEVLVHTGQHYDDELSAVFFDELGHPAARSASSASAAARTREQTARMLAALGAAAGRRAARRGARLRRHELDARRRRWRPRRRGSRSPTSRRACARSTARCRRSSTASLTDHLSRPAARARRRPPSTNLRARGASPGRVELVGDVMVDVALLFQPRARGRRSRRCATPASSRAATCSRPRTAPATSTTRRASRALVDAAAARCRAPVVLPLHPRTRARLEAAGLLDALGGRARAPRAAARLPRLHRAAVATRARC